TGWQGVQIWNTYQHTSPASSCGFIAISTPTPAGDQAMADYMSALLAQAQSKGFEAVVWWENRDYLDGIVAAQCPCPGTNPTCTFSETLYQLGGTPLELQTRYFGNMGLRYNDGTPRTPVHNVWTSYLTQSYSPVPGGDPNTLGQIQVYPNPMRPSLGHTGINFNQLPPGARLRIYTLASEKVNDLNAD